MEFIFFAGLLASLIAIVISGLGFYRYSKNEGLKRFTNLVFFAGVIYIILFILSFLWLFEILEYSVQDFIFIYSFLMFFQGILLFMIFHHISEKKLFFYSLAFYATIFLITIFVTPYFRDLFLAIYFLLVLFISVNLAFRDDGHKNLGSTGLVYSTFSLLLYIVFLTWFEDLYAFSIFFTLLFSWFLFSTLNHIGDHHANLRKKKPSEISPVLTFLGHFAFMLVIINFVLIGTIVIHEFGHLASSSLYDCASGKIVYEDGLPRTEVLCSSDSDTFYMLLGGVGLPILLALVLLLVGGKFMREIGLLIIGFNTMASYRDFSEMGLSANQSIFFVILGITFAVLGIILMAKSRTEDYLYRI